MDDTNTSDRGPARHPNGQFGPGNPGKPRGSRNRMSKRIALSLLGHYHAHEEEFLERLSQFFFPEYVRLIGRMLPRDDPSRAPELESLDAAEQARIVEAVRAACDRIEAGEGTLADVEAALLSLPTDGPAAATYGADTGHAAA
jgi:hypothetical protein